jgi:fumarate hydratase class II
MHIAIILELSDRLNPALKHMQEVFKKKSEDFSSMSTFGPTTLSQEFSGCIHQISMNIEGLKTCQSHLYQLTIDDKGVGTPEGFGEEVACSLEFLTNLPFIDVPNKFEELNTYNIFIHLYHYLHVKEAKESILCILSLRFLNTLLLSSSHSLFIFSFYFIFLLLVNTCEPFIKAQ